MLNLVDLVREDFGISGSDRWYRSEIHSSLVVDEEKQLFYFNSRDLRGGVVDYLISVRGMSKSAANALIKNPSASLPESARDTGLQVRFDALISLFHSSGKNERSYWYKRKINDSTINRYRLGNFEGWNLIPIIDDGLFLNFQCRRDEPDKRIKFWYKDTDFKPVLFNKDILPFVDTIYIVEGLTDCLLLNQLGLPSVCSTNGAVSWNSGWIRFFSKIRNIFYLADNDKAGIVGAKKVMDSLGSSRVKVLRFKDKREKYGVGNFFIDGGTVEEFKDILNSNSIIGFERSLI